MGRATGTKYRFASLLVGMFLAFAIAGCEGDDGATGADGVNGADGAPGADGSDGVACWDLNENGVGDPEEDLNGDGVVDVLDCNAIASDASQAQKLHADYFTDNQYTDTQSCLNCHGLMGQDMLTRAHFTWQGVASNITGFESARHGKNDLLNNFCIAVPTNEGRCAECHAGYGYVDKNFDFGDMKNVDCLVCHDQSGTYVKGLTTGGQPDESVDLGVVARSVAKNGGVPTIANCIGCHAKAGGGDNVKHGDLALSLVNTTREFDVHMGTDGANLDCVACHGVKKDSTEKLVDHGIGGMPYHSVDEGVLKTCVDCHGDAASVHVGTSVQPIINNHQQLACQVCHIPTFARNTPTKTEWYWAEAGDLEKGVVFDPSFDYGDNGVPIYDPKKGRFVWQSNVRPTLRYFDGKWDRFIINANDTFTETPVPLGEPSADYNTVGAMIYPFKKMIGNQPADLNNNTVLVPHLFGSKGGPNPYWAKYDWNLALQDGAAYTGQTYSGAYQFVDTVMYLTVNHEVAPKEQAYGMDGACGDCHGGNQIDWTELGWTAEPEPFGTGTRP
jgi:octaheme c-type cytochrome (tetrathionate reductase family)